MKKWNRNHESSATRNCIIGGQEEYLDSQNDFFCDCYLCCPLPSPLQYVDIEVVEDELYSLTGHSVTLSGDLIYINTDSVQIVCTWESDLMKDMHEYNQYWIDRKIQTKSRFEMSHRPLV